MIVYTDYSDENRPPFRPRYTADIAGDSKFDLAYDPEKPGVIYHYMSDHNPKEYLQSTYARENITNQLLLRPTQLLLFTDKQWEDYGQTRSHGFRSIGEKGIPLMYWGFPDLYHNLFAMTNYTNNSFVIYRIR